LDGRLLSWIHSCDYLLYSLNTDVYHCWFANVLNQKLYQVIVLIILNEFFDSFLLFLLAHHLLFVFFEAHLMRHKDESKGVDVLARISCFLSQSFIAELIIFSLTLDRLDITIYRVLKVAQDYWLTIIVSGPKTIG
jgi:hypothetical protein